MRCKHFRREQLPPPRQFYEREVGQLGRPDRKHWASVKSCPFHVSRNTRKRWSSFYVNLDSGAFCCFSCGVHGGDVIAFVMQRDHLKFKEAAQRLGAWDSAPSPEVVRKIAEQERERERQRQLAEQQAAELHRQRMAAREEIHQDVRLYKEAAARLCELHAGAIPLSATEEDACWSIMHLSLIDLRMAEVEYCVLSGLEPPYGE